MAQPGCWGSSGSMQTGSTFRRDGKTDRCIALSRCSPSGREYTSSSAPRKILIAVFVGQGMVKNRGREVIRNRLEDDRASVGAEVTFARPGQTGGHLADVRQTRGLDGFDLLGAERAGAALGPPWQSAGRSRPPPAAAWKRKPSSMLRGSGEPIEAAGCMKPARGSISVVSDNGRA